MARGRVGAAEGERIDALADLAAGRIARLPASDRRAVDAVAPEDLRDFEAVLQAARYLMFKYEDRREVRALMKDLVGIIERSTDGLGAIDDQIGELVLSAEDSIRRIKDAQACMGVMTLIGGREGAAPASLPPLGAAPAPAPAAPPLMPAVASCAAVPAPAPAAPPGPCPPPQRGPAPPAAASCAAAPAAPPPSSGAPGRPGARPGGVNYLTSRAAIADTGHYQRAWHVRDGAVD